MIASTKHHLRLSQSSGLSRLLFIMCVDISHLFERQMYIIIISGKNSFIEILTVLTIKGNHFCFNEAFSLLYFHFSANFPIVKCKFKSLVVLKQTSKQTKPVWSQAPNQLLCWLTSYLDSQALQEAYKTLSLLTSHILCNLHL